MSIRGKGMAAAALTVFVLATLFFAKANPSFALSHIWIDEKTLGEICVGQAAPSTRILQEDTTATELNPEPSETAKEEEPSAPAEDAAETEDEQETEPSEAVSVTGDPLVIIYHTHSSESYMPYKESNYHRADEKGTVRDVGNVLEEELKKNGIHVIHDKTIHDRPSYNESYSRSLATIQSLVKKYPTAVYIIDLHRDAAASSATEGKYIKIDGKRTATFSMVVGRANENYPELYAFADRISKKSESMYPGFGGKIIEKEYNYNEFVSNKAILLEVGNNKNTIEEARLCGAYFADVLAAIIKEEQ